MRILLTIYLFFDFCDTPLLYLGISLTIKLPGHVGPCVEWMGTYVRNAEYSPVNGGSVYTAAVQSDHHLYRTVEGTWVCSTSEHMRNG